jgi:hypothetical protein
VNQKSDDEKDKFLYPKVNYRGEFSPNNPNNLVFNANLQEFAHKIGYICALETNGKITSAEAYERIKEVWHKLKTSKKELLGDNDLD